MSTVARMGCESRPTKVQVPTAERRSTFCEEPVLIPRSASVTPRENSPRQQARSLCSRAEPRSNPTRIGGLLEVLGLTAVWYGCVKGWEADGAEHHRRAGRGRLAKHGR